MTQVPVKHPVFILGLPRTGTTLVSYMMDADPANRSLLKWEAYDGIPPAAAGALRTDTRCLAEKAKDEMIIEANPTGVAVHFEARCSHRPGSVERALRTTEQNRFVC